MAPVDPVQIRAGVPTILKESRVGEIGVGTNRHTAKNVVVDSGSVADIDSGKFRSAKEIDARVGGREWLLRCCESTHTNKTEPLIPCEVRRKDRRVQEGEHLAARI